MNKLQIQASAIITPVGISGAITMNTLIGRVNIPASTSSITVTNNLVYATSLIFASILTNDTTATIKNIVPTAGAFTINLTANTTAETKIAFYIP